MSQYRSKAKLISSKLQKDRSKTNQGDMRAEEKRERERERREGGGGRRRERRDEKGRRERRE
jgi:hypothetical protein